MSLDAFDSLWKSLHLFSLGRCPQMLAFAKRGMERILEFTKSVHSQEQSSFYQKRSGLGLQWHFATCQWQFKLELEPPQAYAWSWASKSEQMVCFVRWLESRPACIPVGTITELTAGEAVRGVETFHQPAVWLHAINTLQPARAHGKAGRRRHLPSRWRKKNPHWGSCADIFPWSRMSDLSNRVSPVAVKACALLFQILFWQILGNPLQYTLRPFGFRGVLNVAH